MPRSSSVPAAATLALVVALATGACAAFRRAGAVASLKGTVTLDRTVNPPALVVDDPTQGRWKLEGRGVDDLRELDKALIEVRGLGEPRDPFRPGPVGRFTMHAYRLVEVGGKPALVGRLAWEGSDLMLVELDRDDQRVALAGPVLQRLPPLMGKTIWVAGEPHQGAFVVERYGILRR